jgi:hypothetical protein
MSHTEPETAPSFWSLKPWWLLFLVLVPRAASA